ncbi:MAG: hypothetical protein ACUVXA_19345 [Candidatus Jordarchaeum sp.]|uniref:hypothetical protein n=1 Tax=Candidatus Jordarchaeum sp. TaxID=2823881 RepID=UPI00404AEC42
MSQEQTRAFIILGCIGGLYAVLVGLLIMLIGMSIKGNIILIVGLSILFPPFLEYLLTFLYTLLPFLGSITLGPLGGYYVGMIIWDISTFGIIVLVHGFVMVLSAIGVWTGNKWYAALLAIFGLMGMFAFFNLGGLLGLISGLILWYKLK